MAISAAQKPSAAYFLLGDAATSFQTQAAKWTGVDEVAIQNEKSLTIVTRLGPLATVFGISL